MTVNAESKTDKRPACRDAEGGAGRPGAFLRRPRELFVGAKVEGESGFINLMRIKSRYYTEGVFPKLAKDIEAALSPGGNSIGIDPEYCRMALRRLDSESGPLFAQTAIEYRTAAELLAPARAISVADAPKCRPRHIHGRRLRPITQ